MGRGRGRGDLSAYADAGSRCTEPRGHPHPTLPHQGGGLQVAHPRRRAARKPNGFTLVEMMVVIFIIGLLTAVVAYNVFRSQDTAMVTKARSDIARLGQALEMYRLDHARYPSGAEGLQALVTPSGAGGRSDGYIQRLPEDPWGNPYQYSNPGRAAPYDIYSLGADGAPGGEDENADIHAEDS
ncbi:MAG: type II secretion system major pseudopilin GspG [Sphingomonadales bacterium]|nr:type II secretion system major pseudopilin GspG [Sphingomonadales bacterium]